MSGHAVNSKCDTYGTCSVCCIYILHTQCYMYILKDDFHS